MSSDDDRRLVQAETRLGTGEARQGTAEDRQTRAEGRQTEATVRQGETDDRLDAVELLAKANIQAMAEVRGLRDDIAAVDRKRGRDLDLAKIAMALVLLLIVGVGAVVISNRPILNLIKSAATPDGELFQQSLERQRQLFITLVVENDCRDRRALANLPPPPTTIVIKNGLATAEPKMACGDLADSPPGFQSPPRSETPPPPGKAGGGVSLWPYALTLTAGVVIGVGVAIYRTKNREEKQ